MNSPVDNGAPMSFTGINVTRLADADAVALVVGRSYSGVPTAKRIYTLPPLSSTTNGAQLTVQNLGVAAIILAGSGVDPINDTGTPGLYSLFPGQTAIMESKIPDDATPATWFLASPPQAASLFARRSVGQTVDIAGGDQIIFTLNDGSFGSPGTIDLDQSTGVFTLAANQAYECTGTAGACDFSGVTGALALQWYNITGAATFGAASRSIPATGSAIISTSPSARGIIQTTVATQVELRVVLNTLCTGVGVLGSYPFASIKQL